MDTEERKRIEELYLEMFDLLMAYARSSLSREALAEEAVQETFRIACTKASALCASENPKGWLVNTLKNVIQNTRRSQNYAERLVMLYMAQHQESAASEDAVGLDLMYGKVAQSEEFQLLKEMAVDGLSHLEMAQKRGISVDACKKRVQRAKKFLQKKIF